MRVIHRMGASPASEGLEGRLFGLAVAQHGVVSSLQLLALGFTNRQIDRRLESGRLGRLHHGVYLVGGAGLTRHARWMAAVLACGPSAVLSHRDAAALWGMADFALGDVEVTVPGTGTRSQLGIRIHRTRHLPLEDISSRCQIPATTPARTLADLAAGLSLRHLEAAFEEGLRSGVLGPEALREQLGRNRRRRGTRLLHLLVALEPEQIARTRSALEARFLRLCRSEGLPMPEVNAYVGGYEVDASWPGTNVIVELDSWAYHGSRAAFERDRAKWADLTTQGFQVIPVTHRRLTRERASLAAMLRRLLAASRRRRFRRPEPGGLAPRGTR
jgi:very-short-patch-repair endonuclease